MLSWIICAGDQAKPRCQRCVDAHAECKYVAEPFIFFGGVRSTALPQLRSSIDTAAQALIGAVGLQHSEADAQNSLSSCLLPGRARILEKHYLEFIAPWVSL